MNWTIIPLPAPEELAGGYVPPPSASDHSDAGSSLRRILTMLFAVFGLASGLQQAGAANDEPGHRRLAEISIGDRKGPCRDCTQITRSNANGLSDLPTIEDLRGPDPTR
ncbi:hypothetical protein [Erythrobacter sp. Alg231-14]|uniref:hypothetical protein n=1 Tax=Erythrobacter sp. Alg231-14 TaxID=1922225 RepID=UPI000D552B7D